MTEDSGSVACWDCKRFLRDSMRLNRKYEGVENSYLVDPSDACQYCRLRNYYKRQREESDGEDLETTTHSSASIPKRRRRSQDESPEGAVTHKPLTMRQIKEADAKVMDATNYNSFIMEEVMESCLATANDFYDSTKEQLVHLVNWAKCIPAFTDLPMEDQVCLLKDHVADNLILGLVRRSRHMNKVLLLGNGFVVKNGSQDVVNVTGRILDELVAPMKELEVEDTEFACLKAIIFFNLNVPGLTQRDTILSLRNQALLHLQDYILNNPEKPSRGRLGKLLLTLPSLRSIVTEFISEMHYRRIVGTAKIDSLLQETLLAEDDEFVNEFALLCKISPNLYSSTEQLDMASLFSASPPESGTVNPSSPEGGATSPMQYKKHITLTRFYNTVRNNKL